MNRGEGSGTQVWLERARAATETAVEALAAGRGVVVVDDHDREDEGDVVFAAASITSEQVAFLMTHCRGLICVAMEGDLLDRLDVPLMVRHNTEAHRTAFTVSVDAREGISTGISAADRALTARMLAAPGTHPHDLVMPGHLFPLRAHPGGVLARRGHTEAAATLTALAGLPAAGVICEIAAADGTMLRGEALHAFAHEHDMPLLSIDELAAAVR
ncbi:3,4-dihydroxy-2-butanone-4-phosphate synthase [Kineococcus sp. SYSU DK004]|uniref:3,4-dihydroxy-2-butanone-4-phosphate synthase n=1 Tax=Kineococcus sp. SYSU DK004 TaxID=3383125 RepID=UPI003D7D1311